MKKIVTLLFTVVLCFGMTVGCAPKAPNRPSTGDNDITPITIMSSGWVNTPFPKDGDPFRAYIKEKYKLDITVLSYGASDFAQQLQVALAGNNKPDLINFASVSEFNKYYDDGSLIEDFEPYLDMVPNLKNQMLENDYAMNQLATAEDKPKALWGNAEDPTWGLRVRKDWLSEYAATKSKPANYTLATPDDVLDFARWIKTAKNKDQSNLDTYAFTSCGGGNSIGTSLEWTQNMFGFSINGLGNAPQYGFYIDPVTNKVSHPMLDGSYQLWLDFLKTIIRENLISPDWFTNDWTQKNQNYVYNGKTAFDWYPGAIVSETYDMNKKNEETNFGEDVKGWWGSLKVPSNGKYGTGTVPTGGKIGHIWTVSYKTSLDQVKMKKICKLLNDLVVTYGEDSSATDYYQRNEVYDALRWGVGILDNLDSYLTFDSTNLVGCVTAPNADADGTDYRTDNPATWDWGSWFSTRSDGVLQLGSNKEAAKEMALLQGKLDAEVANMNLNFCEGSSFIYDKNKLNAMFNAYVTFTYAYATGKNTETVAEFITRWRTALEGDKMIEEATKQYKALGYMS